ncbi:MAG: alpha/beta hydrolase [Thermoleophilaceae bacterium]|nr:alpha/beta hydrolase [Thermoleophilaceae bacterium]
MRRWIVIGLTAALVAVAVAVAGASWYFSEELLKPDHEGGPYTIKVEGIEARSASGETIVLERDRATERPGTYAFEWKDGHAIVGPVRSQTKDTVTRRLTEVEGELKPGTKGVFNPVVWKSNPLAARGIPYRSVKVPTKLGPMPAWKTAGRSKTWAIYVHGLDGSPAAGLRDLPTLSKAGLPTLLITYRNDVGAPKAPGGLIHLGYTEWEDLDAAARYALDNGAERLVLVGESMGGAIITRFVRKSKLAPRVSALVLDSPALDWQSILSSQAAKRNLAVISKPVQFTVKERADIDYDQLNELKHTKDFEGVPILLFQGLEDPLVPPEDTTKFARALPENLTYFQLPTAAHTSSWNVDPRLYDKRLAAFLRRLGSR